VFKRFRDWVKADVFQRLFDAVSDERTWSSRSIVKVHRHSQGARGTQSQAIGKSKGGLTTKILALTDALGNGPLRPAPRAADTVGVAPLIEDIEFGGLIANKAFEAGRFCVK